MGGDSAFMSMLRIAGFLTAAWTATKLSKLIGISSIVLEITTGVILGPSLFGLMPKHYSTCEAKWFMDCTEPPGFNDGFGTLSVDLSHTVESKKCDPSAYPHHGHEVSSHGVSINFTAAGVMHTYLTESPVLEDAFTKAISDFMVHEYHIVDRRRLATTGHGVTQSPAEHHIVEEHVSEHHIVEEHVSLTLSDFMGSVIVEMVIDAGDAHDFESTIEHDIRNGSFQDSIKGTIGALGIGSVVDLKSLEILDVSASWTNEIFSPWPAATDVSTTQKRFIRSEPNGSLYFQDVNERRCYVDESDERRTADATYLLKCLDDHNPVVISRDEMLSIPVGDKYWGCGLLPENKSESSGKTRSLESAALGGGPSRRLAGGHSYHSYGECLMEECEHNKSSQCQLHPDVFTLVGHTGVGMMIFESGMHFDFAMARQVGPLACVIAVIGTFLPLITGMLLAMAYGNDVTASLTAGTSLAPTSVGISLRLLSEAQVLHLTFGQTIMTAAFVDDILSLILFNIIFAVAAGEITFMGTFFQSIVGVIFMLFAILLAVVFWPKALKNYLLPGAEAIKRKLSPIDPDDPPKISEKDEALFAIMLAMLLGYGLITYLCGTHLWGCFIAGMSFACLDEEPGHAHHVWVKQTKRITSWMIRIFFACTVAFSIPLAELLSLKAFLLGSIMGIGPCILTKVSCAFFMGPPKFVIGWAMVGRAEFAYLIAQMGLAGGMMNDELFSQLIWALLWATIFAPLIFRYVLNKYIVDKGIEVGSPKKPHAPALDGHGDAHKLVDAEAPREMQHVVEETDFAAPKTFAAPEPSQVKEAPAVAEKPWEEEALGVGPSKPAEELPPIPSLNHQGSRGAPQGRGFLCCIFFKKMTVV